ncbi:MAG: hypothetical protein KKA64_03205 [Nanoarchaeota archaeon]|nr:hypothetical protein [Nanoarchaeota archaeon]
MVRGKLITFEGIDGCGKDTQTELFCRYLSSMDIAFELKREPGGEPFAEVLRNVVKDPKYKGQVEGITELFIYEAARAQLVNRVLRPKSKSP